MVSPGLVPGVARTLTYRVQPGDLVNTLFPGASEFARKPAVLATGILVALCEWPAMDALRQVIGDDEDSLGTRVCVSHQAPVWAGTKLTVTARCVSVTGRASRWDVGAYDGTRTVGCGWVEFAVVRTAAFLERHRHEMRIKGGDGFCPVPVCATHHRLIEQGEPWLWVPWQRLKGTGSDMSEGCILMGEELAGYGLVVDVDVRVSSSLVFKP
jgi:fluoroacetyl-CoA thioesterase